MAKRDGLMADSGLMWKSNDAQLDLAALYENLLTAAETIATAMSGVPVTGPLEVEQGDAGSEAWLIEHEDETVLVASSTCASSGDNIIVAAAAGFKYRLVRVFMQDISGTETTALLKLGTAVVERVLCANKGDGLSVVYAEDARPVSGANEAITINLSGANSHGYAVHYIKEAV